MSEDQEENVLRDSFHVSRNRRQEINDEDTAGPLLTFDLFSLELLDYCIIILTICNILSLECSVIFISLCILKELYIKSK